MTIVFPCGKEEFKALLTELAICVLAKCIVHSKSGHIFPQKADKGFFPGYLVFLCNFGQRTQMHLKFFHRPYGFLREQILNIF